MIPPLETRYRPYFDNPQWPYPKGTREEDITQALVANARTAFLIDERCRQYETVAYFVDMERQGRAPEGRAAQCWESIQARRYGLQWKGLP